MYMYLPGEKKRREDCQILCSINLCIYLPRERQRDRQRERERERERERLCQSRQLRLVSDLIVKSYYVSGNNKRNFSILCYIFNFYKSHTITVTDSLTNTRHPPYTLFLLARPNGINP